MQRPIMTISVARTEVAASDAFYFMPLTPWQPKSLLSGVDTIGARFASLRLTDTAYAVVILIDRHV